MLEYIADREKDLTLFVGSSDVPLEEWLETLKDYAAGGTTRLEVYELVNVSGFLTNSDVRAIASLSDSLSVSRPDGGKTAIISRKPVHRWLVRFFMILSEVAGVGFETRLFSTLDEAVRWLEISAEDVHSLRTRLERNSQRL